MTPPPSDAHSGHVDADHVASLAQLYERELQRLGLQADVAQRHAVQQLDDLRQRLVAAKKPKSIWQRWWQPRQATHEMERGLYMWGGVGRGKTWLMDLFYDSLPFKQKQRAHFHRFMQFVHDELKQHRDRADPLDIIAQQLATKIRVLCFDEFFVTDIADAMLLGNLLRGLFDRGVTLVATSNCAPDELYKDGLQRARFLPAIRLLKENTLVLNVDSGIDYRLRQLEHARTWFDANDAGARPEMQDLFARLAPDGVKPDTHLTVNHRKIKAKQLASAAAWFDFREICDGPRGQADYIELARCYHSVFISDMPQLTIQMENQARRFISMIDEFYDRGVKLFIAAATPPERIYQGERLQFEFQRTLSRLIEMQSKEYLALPHQP